MINTREARYGGPLSLGKYRMFPTIHRLVESGQTTRRGVPKPVMKWIERNAPKQLEWFARTGDFPLYRGVKGDRHTQPGLYKTGSRWRPATGECDMYKRACDDVSSPPFPKRSLSIICSTSAVYASSYGRVGWVVPGDDAAIGVVPKEDIWHTGILENTVFVFRNLGFSGISSIIARQPSIDRSVAGTLERELYFLFHPICKSWEHTDVDEQVRRAMDLVRDACDAYNIDEDAFRASINKHAKHDHNTELLNDIANAVFEHSTAPFSQWAGRQISFNYATYGCSVRSMSEMLSNGDALPNNEAWFQGEYAFIPMDDSYDITL